MRKDTLILHSYRYRASFLTTFYGLTHLVPLHATSKAKTYSAYVIRTISSWQAHSRPNIDQAARFWANRHTAEKSTSGFIAELVALSGADQHSTIETQLRVLRQWLIVTLYYADVSGDISVADVCKAMTQFAAYACQQAVNAAAGPLTERFGIPLDASGKAQDLIIMAMGKGGSDELNVSSDLDIVFLHRDNPYPAGETSKGFSSSEVLERIARKTSLILNDTTSDGFVFRIDTRLRPFGDEGPLVCSIPMLEKYLLVNGREWERFAWLKANCVASTHYGLQQDRSSDLQDLERLLTPFVYRRYLDFQAVDSLRDLHQKIRDQANTKQGTDQGVDVKLGRGGIREIEFIAQLLQIIRGGKEAGLRCRSTVESLERLASLGVMPIITSKKLIAGYWFLRRVEHMLQYVNDQQTHWLDEGAHELVADMLKMPIAQFNDTLKKHLEFVSATFDSVLGQAPQAEPAQRPTSAVPESTVTNPNYKAIAEHIASFKKSRRYTQASNSTTLLFDDLLPAAHSSASIEGAIAFINLIETLGGRPGYLTLLARFTEVRQRLIRLLGKAKWAADYLRTHPIVLDELLGEAWLESVNYADWFTQTQTSLQALDLERQLDVIREAHHAQVFRLLAQDIEGRLETETLSDHLSSLADKVVQLTLGMAWQQLQQSSSTRFLRKAEPDFAVIAYGKLGGKELGYASDLDLVYVFDYAETEQDQAADTYAVLAQKLSAYLSLTTSAGQLFDVDTRLRPDGASGLLAVSLQAFEKYQTQSAWVWEHQALTRARCMSDHPKLLEGFEQLRRKILSAKRLLPQLALEIKTMRQKMHDGHPNKSELFDLKHDKGGMVDIEFIVQFLVLAYSSTHPSLLDNLGNIALLKRASEAGLVDSALADKVSNAYRFFRQRQHAIRLNDNAHAACRVAPETVTAAAAAVTALWRATIEDTSSISARE